MKFPEGSEGQQWFLTPSEARNKLINTGLKNINYFVTESLETEMINRSKYASLSPVRKTLGLDSPLGNLSTTIDEVDE